MSAVICPSCHTFLHHQVDTCYFCGKQRVRLTTRADFEVESGMMQMAALAQSGEQPKLQRRWWTPDKEHSIYR